MRRDLIRCTIAAVLLLSCGRSSPIRAEEPLTVDEAVNEALSHHPAIKASAARVDQADGAHRAVWETYAPQLSVFGGVQRNRVSGATTTTTPGDSFTPPSTVVQRFSQSDTRFLSGANVDEFLFDFGSFPAQRRSTAAARQAQLSALETQRLDVTLNVKQTYFGLLRVNRLLAYNRETVERRESRVAEIAKAAGAAKRRSDVLQADVDLANARLNLSRTESDYTNVEAKFLESIGQRTRVTRKLVDDVSLKPISLTLEQASARALAIRPELDQAQAMIESQEATVEAIRASYLPRVSAFAGVSNLTGLGSSDLDQLTVLSGGLNVTIPTAWVLSKGRLDQARAAVEELKARKLELEQSITVGVSRSYAALFAAIERIRVTQGLATNAAASWNDIQERYRSRKATILESTEAYNFLYAARVSLIHALYDAKISEAELERAVGQSF
jgi:outer membrane protein